MIDPTICCCEIEQAFRSLNETEKIEIIAKMQAKIMYQRDIIENLKRKIAND